MKKHLMAVLLGGLMTLGLYAQRPVLTNYSYKFKINGLKDTVCYLGFHFGDKKFVRDTARINSKGEVEFKGKDTIMGGMYLFVLPNKKWFEFVINEPSFSIETDTTDFIGKMKIKGSVENTLWIEYLRFMQSKQKRLDEITKGLDTIKDKKSKAYKDLEDASRKESEEINAYRTKLMKDNPNAFVTSLFKAMKDVEIPDGLDSTQVYWFYRNHYFDNVDLLDSRILRTPIFESKLMTYFEKVLPQVPDTIIAEADKMVERVRKEKDMFKFVMHTITYNYERSQIMCMDGVFVHMVDNYYRQGQCDWVDKKTMDKMIERADKLRPVLCGKQVMNLCLPDTNKVWHKLYDLKGEITILYFWDATCSHCKKATPKLKELYESYLKPKGIEVYAVEGELENDEWLKYLKEYKLPFINVSDDPDMNAHPEKYIIEQQLTDLNSLNFRHHFDLATYPVMFVLDKDKKIIAKKIGVEQLQDFLDRYIKLKGLKLPN